MLHAAINLSTVIFLLKYISLTIACRKSLFTRQLFLGNGILQFSAKEQF